MYVYMCEMKNKVLLILKNNVGMDWWKKARKVGINNNYVQYLQATPIHTPLHVVLHI